MENMIIEKLMMEIKEKIENYVDVTKNPNDDDMNDIADNCIKIFIQEDKTEIKCNTVEEFQAIENFIYDKITYNYMELTTNIHDVMLLMFKNSYKVGDKVSFFDIKKLKTVKGTIVKTGLEEIDENEECIYDYFNELDDLYYFVKWGENSEYSIEKIKHKNLNKIKEI